MEFILVIFWEEGYLFFCVINILYFNFWLYVVFFDKNELNVIYVVKNKGIDNLNLNEFLFLDEKFGCMIRLIKYILKKSFDNI